MSFYARLINTERWRNFASCNSLPGEAITLDWECKNNEWSVFKCDSFSSGKNDLMDKIALYLVAKSPQKTESGVDLLVIDDVFIKKQGPNKSNYPFNLTDIVYSENDCPVAIDLINRTAWFNLSSQLQKKHIKYIISKMEEFRIANK